MSVSIGFLFFVHDGTVLVNQCLSAERSPATIYQKITSRQNCRNLQNRVLQYRGNFGTDDIVPRTGAEYCLRFFTGTRVPGITVKFMINHAEYTVAIKYLVGSPVAGPFRFD